MVPKTDARLLALTMWGEVEDGKTGRTFFVSKKCVGLVGWAEEGENKLLPNQGRAAIRKQGSPGASAAGGNGRNCLKLTGRAQEIFYLTTE